MRYANFRIAIPISVILRSTEYGQRFHRVVEAHDPGFPDLLVLRMFNGPGIAVVVNEASW